MTCGAGDLGGVEGRMKLVRTRIWGVQADEGVKVDERAKRKLEDVLGRMERGLPDGDDSVETFLRTSSLRFDVTKISPRRAGKRGKKVSGMPYSFQKCLISKDDDDGNRWINDWSEGRGGLSS